MSAPRPTPPATRTPAFLRCALAFLVAVTVIGVWVATPIRASAQTESPAATVPTTRPVLRVAVRPLQPFVIPAGNGRYSGFSIDLLRDIADEAGFDVQYVEVGSVGAQLEAVQQGRADLAIGAISITSAREAVLDFSTAMFESGIQAMVSDSAQSVTVGMLAGKVFSREMVIVFSLMVLGTILTGVFVWAWERRHGNDHFTNDGPHGVFDGIWWATVTLFTIGYGDKVPHKVLSRIVTMVWMFVGVLMVATVTAHVTSSLTIDRLDSSINSVADLAGKDVVTLPGTTSWDFLVEHGVDPQPVGSIDEAYDQVRSGEAFAFVYDMPIIHWVAATRGGVVASGPVMRPENYGIAFPDGSAWIEPVDQALLRVREDGRFERLKRAYFD